MDRRHNLKTYKYGRNLRNANQVQGRALEAV